MKSILYVVRYPLHYTYSIMQKVNGQIQSLKNLGYEVSFLCYDEGSIYLNRNGELIRISKTTFGPSKLYFHLFSYMDLYKSAEYVIKTFGFDVVYIRAAPLNHCALGMFKAAAEKSKVVVEISTYSKNGVKEPQSFLRKVYGFYSNSLWERATEYVDLFVLIGDYADTYCGRPAVNIDNGVSLDVIPIKEYIEPPDGKTHILAVASMSMWHGYDRLIKGFNEWDAPQKENYVIDLVGDEGDGSLNKWKLLVDDLGLNKQILFHGRKTGAELSYYYNIASIGVSSLGFYRLGYKVGSVLKLREYMARGLPFVYAHDDPGIKGDKPWCVKIVNEDIPVDMSILDGFIQSVKGRQNLSEMLREYAEQNMTWEAQFSKMFSALEENK